MKDGILRAGGPVAGVCLWGAQFPRQPREVAGRVPGHVLGVLRSHLRGEGQLAAVGVPQTQQHPTLDEADDGRRSYLAALLEARHDQPCPAHLVSPCQDEARSSRGIKQLDALRLDHVLVHSSSFGSGRELLTLRTSSSTTAAVRPPERPEHGTGAHPSLASSPSTFPEAPQEVSSSPGWDLEAYSACPPRLNLRPSCSSPPAQAIRAICHSREPQRSMPRLEASQI